MAKIWFAGPKKGQGNFFNVRPASLEGYVIQFICLFALIFSSHRIADYLGDSLGIVAGLLVGLSCATVFFLGLRFAAVTLFRSHVDYAVWATTPFEDGDENAS